METTQLKPEPGRAGYLYDVMKMRLADSLEYIISELRQSIRLDDDRLSFLIQRIRELNQVSPSIFGYYYEILFSLHDDDLVYAEDVLAKLAIQQPEANGFSVRAFRPGDLGKDTFALYQQLSREDANSTLQLISPTAEDENRVSEMVFTSLALLDNAVPDLAKEIRTVVAEVVLASNEHNGEDLEFHGISSVYLWGAIFINASQHRSLMHVLETLVHESSHSLLFALSMDEPLVSNSYDAGYASPLRIDPRPMDGIFHATYVLARMYYGLKAVADSGALTKEQLAEVNHRLPEIAQSYRDGLTTVEKDGDLTATGDNIIRGTKAYMSSVAQL